MNGDNFEAYTSIDPRPLSEGWLDLRKTPLDVDNAAILSIPRLFYHSKQAVEEASYSYRNFNVGLAMFAVDTRGQRSGVYYAGNVTPLPAAEDGTPWGCSERYGRNKLRLNGFDRVLAMAITGPLKPDTKRPLITPTLHPCYRCRNMFLTDTMFSDDTLVATSTIDGKTKELHTARGLIDLYNTGIKPESPISKDPILAAVWDQTLRMDDILEQDRRDLATLKHMAEIQGLQV